MEAATKSYRPIASRRIWLFRGITIALILCLGLVAGEFALRAIYAYKLRGELKEQGVPRASDPDVEIGLIDLLVPSVEPDIVYRMVPNLVGRFKGHTVRLNSKGWRDDEFEIVKPPNTIRIVTLGDSHTFGWGVDAQESYPSLLETSLDALTQSDPKVEVINLGLPSYNATQEAALFESDALPLSPDLVVLQFDRNDSVLPAFLLDQQILTARKLYLLDALKILTGRIIPENALTIQPTDPDAVPESPVDVRMEDIPVIYQHMVGWEAVERAYSRIASLCKENGIPLYILILAHETFEDQPLKERDERYDGIRELARKLDLPVIDTFDATRQFVMSQGIRSRDLQIHMDDPHPTPPRHAIMAREVLKAIAPPLSIGTPEMIEEQAEELTRRAEEGLKK